MLVDPFPTAQGRCLVVPKQIATLRVPHLDKEFMHSYRKGDIGSYIIYVEETQTKYRQKEAMAAILPGECKRYMIFHL